MILTDTAELAGTRRTADGYLVAEVRAGRTGIQLYSGREVGRPDLPIVRVYRPEDEVFDAAAMATAAHRPVTINHPAHAVTAETWKDVSVGMTGGEVIRDGKFLRVPMVLMDSGAIEDVEGGKRQLSWGYTCDLDWTSGQTADGEQYDAVQRGIRINHLAVVQRGRAGEECRIGDAGAAGSATPPTNSNGGRAMPDADIRTVVVDGLSIPVTTQGAEVITRLQGQMADAARVADAQRADLTRQVEARDGQIAALRAEQTRLTEAHQGELAALRASHQQALDALNGQLDALRAQTTDAALDARVAARTALVTQARRVLGDSYDATGQSDDQIRRAVVAKALPTLPLDDSKGEAYVLAAYDAVMASPAMAAPAPAAPAVPAQADTLTTAFTHRAAGGTPAADAAPQLSAWERNRLRLERAHLTAGEKGAA